MGLRTGVKIAGVLVALALVVASVGLARRGDEHRVKVASAPGHSTARTAAAPTTTTTTTTLPAATLAPPVTTPPETEPPAVTEPPVVVDPPGYGPPATLSARIVLPSTTMTAGSSMWGSVIVENPGPPVHVIGCLGYFQVALGNDTIEPDPVWPMCATDVTIPTGTSSYAVTVRASYAACVADPPPATGVPCLANGGAPPLPPGDYRAILFQAQNPTKLPISVEPIPVTIT